MSRKRKDTSKPPLEPTLVRNGQVRPRCQATSLRTGKQCMSIAHKDTGVCKVHGSPAGRPSTLGLYSKSGKTRIEELMQLSQQQQDRLDDAEPELHLMRGVVWYLLEQEDRVRKLQGQLESLQAYLESHLNTLDIVSDPEALRLLGEALRNANKAATSLDTYTERLSVHASRITEAIKRRAETRLKLLEAKGLQLFIELSAQLKDLALEYLDPDQYEALYERMKRDLYTRIPRVEVLDAKR